MKKFAALLSIAAATALVSPMAMAKTSRPQTPKAAHAKHVTPPRGPNGRFLSGKGKKA